MVRGWLERGVDGFRLDVFNVFLKHPDLPSNPTPARDDRRGPARSTVYDPTSPTCRTSSARFRAIVDERPGPDVGRRAVRRARPRAPRR